MQQKCSRLEDLLLTSVEPFSNEVMSFQHPTPLHYCTLACRTHFPFSISKFGVGCNGTTVQRYNGIVLELVRQLSIFIPLSSSIHCIEKDSGSVQTVHWTNDRILQFTRISASKQQHKPYLISDIDRSSAHIVILQSSGKVRWTKLGY